MAINEYIVFTIKVEMDGEVAIWWYVSQSSEFQSKLKAHVKWWKSVTLVKLSYCTMSKYSKVH